MSEAGEPDASSASLTDGANDNIADDGNGEKHMDSSPGAEKVMDNAGENVDDTTDENISVVKEVGAEEISPPSMEEISEAEEENLSETKESSAEVRDEVKEGTPEFAENSPENEEVSEENEDISPEHEEISPQDTETSPQNEEISQDNEEISEENEEKISEENEESSREDAEMSPQNEEISQESSLNEGMSPQHEEISEENEVTSQENEDISQDGESNDADVTEEKEVEDLPENTDKSETGDVDEMLEEKDAESEKDNAEPMEENRVTESPTNEDELLEDEQGTTEEKEEDQGKKMQEAVDEEDINAESKEENRVTESQIDEDELLEDEEDATDKMVEDQGQEMTEAVDEKDNTESKEENRVTESPINEDELLEDNQDTKEDRVEGQKLEMQEALDEDKLLETTEEKNEGAEVSPSADGSEKKSSESENQESQDSTGDMTLQIGSVTGNAEMLEDAEMMDVDQDSSKQNGDQENQKMDSDESKKIDDVEMVDAKKDDETKQDDQSEKDEKMEKDAKVKSVDTDVEMKDDEKKEESEGKLTTVKEEPGQTKTDSKPAEDDDIKIIDIPSDDDDQSGSKGVKAVVKEEKKEEKPGEDGGEMCLQIASVSGGVDMLDQNDDEKNDVKKVDGIQVKEESSALKSSDIKQEVKSPESKPKSASKTQTCIVCQKIGKCKYNIVRNGDIKHLCDDVCFKQFRANPTMFLRASSDGQPAKKPDSPAQAPVQAPPIAPPPQERYKTCSICQLMNVKTSKPFLNWQGMDFCGEDCLGKFQGGLNAACNYCGQTVQQTSKGKFCARIGNDVKQFCSGPCFNEFKKRQKLCEFCQKDVTKISDAFVAPVGKDALFKDFCSQDCLQKYEEKSNRDIEIVGIERPKKSQVPPKGNFQCAVCRKTGPVKHEIKLEGKMNRLCSDPCFSAFQYANKLTMNTCDNCGVYCYNEGMAPQYIQFEGQQKRFCSFMCVNTFKTLNKKVVSCAWCNCKKSNFDMIERVDANNKYQLFCSLNCLSLYRVNLQATSNQAVMCDQCRKFVPAQYHLTMSDASVRNFCSYQCVMTFQSQFAGGTKTQTPIMNTGNQQKPAAPAPANSRTSTRASTGPKSARANTAQQKQPNIPIISNVVSLSNQNAVPQQVRANQMPTLVNSQVQQIRPIMTTTSMQTPPQQIIIQPPPPKTVKNKSLLCKPFVQTKATSCRPHTQTKETQTEEDWEPKKCLVPIPIPYFIPVPMMMYSQYTPVPLPIPIPIPVPCFIPTTKKSASSILKQIKEIQERIPNDPLEAELLMMAEAVAVAEPESESESENEDILPVSKATLAGDGTTVSPPPSPLTNSVPVREATPTPSQPNGEFSEDMLQMALRMATEMTSEPVLDLETSIDPVPVNTGLSVNKITSEDIRARSIKVKAVESEVREHRQGVTLRIPGTNFTGCSQNLLDVKSVWNQKSFSNHSTLDKKSNADIGIKKSRSLFNDIYFNQGDSDIQESYKKLQKNVKIKDFDCGSRENFKVSHEIQDKTFLEDQWNSFEDVHNIKQGLTIDFCNWTQGSSGGYEDISELGLNMEVTEEEYNYIFSDPEDDDNTCTYADFNPGLPTETDSTLVPIHPLLQDLRTEMTMVNQTVSSDACNHYENNACWDQPSVKLDSHNMNIKKRPLPDQEVSGNQSSGKRFKRHNRRGRGDTDIKAKKKKAYKLSKAQNIRNITRWAVKKFKAWCTGANITMDLSTVQPQDLACNLEGFYKESCLEERCDENPAYQLHKYPRATICVIRSSLRRHIFKLRHDIDIILDGTFATANQVLKGNKSKPRKGSIFNSAVLQKDDDGDHAEFKIEDDGNGADVGNSAEVKKDDVGNGAEMQQSKKSTEKVARWAVKNIQKWCDDNWTQVHIDSVSPKDLAVVLERFYIEATCRQTKKTPLSLYQEEECTYKKNTLYLMRTGLNHYFKVTGRPIDIVKGSCFKAANRALKTKQ